MIEFKVEKSVLESGVKILFAVILGIDNTKPSPEWMAYREKRLEELYELYKDMNIKEDPILEGYNILHDRTGVKRRKNIPAGENLIKHLVKTHTMPFINPVVDIYNLISIETKLALGAQNIDKVSGNMTLRFTTGSERFVPLGSDEPVPVNAHEYCYCDDDNEVLCRLEIRQVKKTLVDESAVNVLYIVEGNDATSEDYLRDCAQKIIDTTTRYCGGTGKIVHPEII